MLKTILGKRGKGKTTLAQNLIKYGDADQVFILDWLAEYHELKSPNIHIFFDNLALCGKKAWLQAGDHKTLMVFDEIDLYGKNNIYLDYLYRYGRHGNIDIIAVARRFYDLPVIVRSQTQIFFLFQITEERDLHYLRYLVPKSWIQKLINLKDWEFLTLKL